MSTIGTFLGGVPTITPGQGTSNFNGYNSAIGQGIGSVGTAQGNQSALIQALQNQANGIGPSVAQQQFQQNNQRIAAQAAGAIAGQKGINPGLQGQLIARNQAAVQGQAAGQGALARTQEQLGAQSQLGGAIGQQGQLGLGLAGLGTQGQLGQNGEYIQQQGIAAGQNATNAGIGQSLLGSLAKGASSAAAIPAVASLLQGKWAGGPIDYRDGGSIPGHASVSGDSRRNDTVPIMASPDEIMIPRSITMHPNAGELAKQFVEGIMAKKGMGKQGYAEGGSIQMPANTDYTPSTMASYLDSAVRGVTQGASANFGDEASAGLSHLAGNGSYQDNLDEYRKADDAAFNEHPYVYGLANIAGTALGPGRITPGSSAGNFLQRTGISALKGAGLGAVSGFGSGRGLADSADQALLGSAIGSMVGATGPTLKALAGEVLPRIKGLFTSSEPSTSSMPVPKPSPAAQTLINMYGADEVSDPGSRPLGDDFKRGYTPQNRPITSRNMTGGSAYIDPKVPRPAPVAAPPARATVIIPDAPAEPPARSAQQELLEKIQKNSRDNRNPKKPDGSNKMADGGVVPYPYKDPNEGKVLPAPPLIRAPVPLPFRGGSIDRYTPLDQQLKSWPKPKAGPVDAGTPDDSAPKKTYFATGGMVEAGGISSDALQEIIRKALVGAFTAKGKSKKGNK